MLCTDKQIGYITWRLFGHMSPFRKRIKQTSEIRNGIQVNTTGETVYEWIEGNLTIEQAFEVIGILKRGEDTEEEAFELLIAYGIPLA